MRQLVIANWQNPALIFFTAVHVLYKDARFWFRFFFLSSRAVLICCFHTVQVCLHTPSQEKGKKRLFLSNHAVQGI